jgi:hypothetical protein
MLLGPKSGMCEYVGARRAAEGVSGVEDQVSAMSLLSSITSSHPSPLMIYFIVIYS